MIIPFTSKIKASQFPFTIVVEPDSFNNLNAPSVALIFQIRAIDKKRLVKKIGEISQEALKEIKEKLKEFLDINET